MPLILTEVFVIDDLTNEKRRFENMKDVQIFISNKIGFEADRMILFRNKSRKTRAYRRFYITTNKEFKPKVFTTSKAKQVVKEAVKTSLNERMNQKWFAQKTRIIKS